MNRLSKLLIGFLFLLSFAPARAEDTPARTPHGWPIPATETRQVFEVEIEVTARLELPDGEGEARSTSKIHSVQKETFTPEGNSGAGALVLLRGHTRTHMETEAPGIGSREMFHEDENARMGPSLLKRQPPKGDFLVGSEWHIPFTAAGAAEPHLAWARFALPPEPPRDGLRWRHRCFFVAAADMRETGWNAESRLGLLDDDHWTLVTSAAVEDGPTFRRELSIRKHDGLVVGGSCLIDRLVPAEDGGEAELRIELHAKSVPLALPSEAEAKVAALLMKLRSYRSNRACGSCGRARRCLPPRHPGRAGAAGCHLRPRRAGPSGPALAAIDALGKQASETVAAHIGSALQDSNAPTHRVLRSTYQLREYSSALSRPESAYFIYDPQSGACAAAVMGQAFEHPGLDSHRSPTLHCCSAQPGKWPLVRCAAGPGARGRCDGLPRPALPPRAAHVGSAADSHRAHAVR